MHNILTPDKDFHEISAQLNPENIPYLEDKGLIRYLPRLHGYHASRDAQGICDIFKYYFNSHTMAAPKSLLQTVTILHNIVSCTFVNIMQKILLHVPLSA